MLIKGSFYALGFTMVSAAAHAGWMDRLNDINQAVQSVNTSPARTQQASSQPAYTPPASVPSSGMSRGDQLVEKSKNYQVSQTQLDAACGMYNDAQGRSDCEKRERVNLMTDAQNAQSDQIYRRNKAKHEAEQQAEYNEIKRRNAQADQKARHSR